VRTQYPPQETTNAHRTQREGKEKNMRGHRCVAYFLFPSVVVVVVVSFNFLNPFPPGPPPPARHFFSPPPTAVAVAALTCCSSPNAKGPNRAMPRAAMALSLRLF
jgi:hypothetical protein